MKLRITMARLDQKILEFTAAAAGEQLPAPRRRRRRLLRARASASR